MKKVILFFTFLIAISLVGCSSITTTTDFDPSIDFNKYKTYVWFNGEMPAEDALTSHPLVKKRLVSSLERALEAKGFKKGTSDSFDFVIIMHAGTKERVQVNTYNYGGYGYGGYGHGWGGYGGYGGTSTNVNYYDEATLVVDIADANKNELVWRGTATGVVSKTDKTREEAQEDSDEVINMIMAKFPPQKAE